MCIRLIGTTLIHMKVIDMNNREFKFRVWDGYSFAKDFYISSNGWVYEDSCDEGDELGSYHLVSVKNPVIQEYIGLKDKNRKDIFEGDIVKIEYDNGSTVNGLVHYAYNEFVVSFNGFYFNNLLKGTENCEVIGNMFENSELLYEKF